MALVRGWPLLVMILLARTAQAQQPPRICSPVDIGGRPTGAPCVDQGLPAIGPGPKGPIVVWHESELGVVSRLVATRIDDDGTPSATFHVVSPQVSPLSGAAVVATANGLLTVWAESKVVAGFLGDDGQRLGPTIELFDRSDLGGIGGLRYGAAASGSTVLIAAAIESQILVRRLSHDGLVLDDEQTIGVGGHPVVAADQSGFMVAFTSTSGVVLARLDERSGGVTARRHLGPGHSATIAFGEGQFRVVWMDADEQRVWALAIDPSSDLGASAPQLLVRADRTLDDPVLSPEGTQVVFVDREEPNDHWNLYAVPFSGDAAPTRLTQTADRASAPAMAAGSGGAYLVWSATTIRSIAPSVLKVARAADGVLMDRPVGGEACRRDPAIAAGSGGDLSVAWLDGGEGGVSYWAQPLDSALRGTGSAFGVVGPGVAYSRPVLARVGDRTAMAYVGTDNSDFALFVATFGRSSSDSTNLKLSTPAFASLSLIVPPISAVAGPSDLALIAWRGISGSQVLILGALVGADGQVVAGPFTISEDVVNSNWAGLAEAPVAAWNGSDWLVLWQDARVALDAPEIYGARVKPDGSVADERLVLRADRPTALALGFGGQDYLLGWRSFSSPGGFATRLDLSGAPLDDPPLEVIELDGMGPVIAAVPEGYMFGWSAGTARAIIIEGGVVPNQPFAIAHRDGVSYDELALTTVDDTTLVAVTEQRVRGETYRSSTIEARQILLDRGDCATQTEDGCGCTTTGGGRVPPAGWLIFAALLLCRVREGARHLFPGPFPRRLAEPA